MECIDEAGRQLEAIGRDLDEALGELIDAVRLASPDSSLARDGIVQALEEYEDGGTDQEPGTDTSPGDNPHETRRVEDDGIQHLQIREIPDDGLPLGVN